jgi:hypothetical protein
VRDDVTVMLHGKLSVRISANTAAIPTGFRSLPQSLQGNDGIILRLGHRDLLLPNLLRVMSHSTIGLYDYVVK